VRSSAFGDLLERLPHAQGDLRAISRNGTGSVGGDRNGFIVGEARGGQDSRIRQMAGERLCLYTGQGGVGRLEDRMERVPPGEKQKHQGAEEKQREQRSIELGGPHGRYNGNGRPGKRPRAHRRR
jgi:hypothetical protein